MAISRLHKPVVVAPSRGVIAGQPALRKKIDNAFLIGVPLVGSVGFLFWYHSHPIHAVEVVTFILGYFIIGMGTGVGFHRYFSHKSFQTSPWVAYLLGAAGSMSFQSSLLTWIADHRRHHSQTDHCGDAHSPIVDGHCHHTDSLKGLFHAHIGWMFDDTVTDRNIYGRDLARDPIIRFYARTHYIWPVLSLALPGLIGYAFGGSTDAWGCVLAACLRTMLFQHSVWAVNSFGHTFGYENYNMRNNSKNNTFLAALTFGDGYHNNHHRYPRSAFHGLRKGELDLNGIIITWLGKLGLARKIIFADRYLCEKRPSDSPMRASIAPAAHVSITVPPLPPQHSNWGQCSIGGAGVPSDDLPTQTRKIVTRS
jgi:stearoyl-CoA desaturase (delta-9 desaturase)